MLSRRKSSPVDRARMTSFVLVGAVAAAAACDAADSYVYTARRYDADAACLHPYHAVEVVEGPGAAATCPETCLTVGNEVFVTTMCPPLPTIATELEANAEACIAARRASSRTCGAEPESDASSTDPDAAVPTTDASDSSAPSPSTDLDATTPDAGDSG
jgi:hypothetical protein